MLQHEKQQVLNSIKSENELRTELVIPLLKKMKQFSEVLDNQGADEAGVDVIAVSTSPFKKAEYTAVILKCGDITLKVADQKNNLINIVETQIREAMRIPLTHPRLPSGKIIANTVIVLTNGNISNKAEHALRKTFPELNLDFVGQDRLLDNIDALWPRFYEDRRPFLSSYAYQLLQSLNVLNLEELGYAKKNRNLSDIYIDSLLYEEESVAASNFDFEKEPIAGEQLCKQPHKLMAIISGPGGGKSTLLKEIAISQSKDERDQVAVYLHARDVFEAKDILRTSAETLSRLSNESPEDVYKEIKDTKLLLLIDGLDELAVLGDREEVIARLVDAQTSIGARVILGTRPESNPTVLAALGQFKAYSISPLKKSQIRSFFGKWFKENIDKASRLMTALEDKGVFDKLPKTPMTMTLVAIVYESKEDIPSTLTELYEMFVGLLTGKWDANRRISSPFDSKMKLAFLARLANTMQQERLDNISSDRCLTLADEFFSNEATLQGVDSRAFIQSIIDRSHILIPTGSDQLRFSHMTFQEYFCAEYLFREFPATNTILEWFGDDWWKEVLFFLAGKKQNVALLVDALLTTEFNNPETRITKLVTLGSMLQAAVLTPAKQKVDAISFSAEQFMGCFDDLHSAIAKIKSRKIRDRVSRFVQMNIVQELFTANFCSIHLHQALKDVYAGLPKDREHHGARFFIASALSKMQTYDPLLEFATDPDMIDTSMYLLSGVGLSKQQMTEGEQERYRRLKKRAEHFRSALKLELGPLYNKPTRIRRALRKKKK